MTTLRARALVFDMDGAIVDSTAVEGVWRRYAEQECLDLAELLSFSHGRQTPDTLRRFSPHLSEEEALALLVGVPGVRRLLGSLGAVPWAVVTSARWGTAEQRFATAGLPHAPVLVAAAEIERGTPGPDGYPRAAQALGVDPSECLVFEDAGTGIEAGLAAGAQVVIVASLESPAAQGLPRIADLRGVASRRRRGRRRAGLTGGGSLTAAAPSTP